VPTYRQLEAAARIGGLALAPDRAAAAQGAVRTLADALGGDACSLAYADPLDGRHRPLATLDYPHPVDNLLATTFADTPWFSKVLDSELPASISTEENQSFFYGWLYQQHLAPAGYRDGMSGALHYGDRYVGLVHLSSSTVGRFDADARHTLNAVLPALALLVDPLGATCRDTTRASWRAVVVRMGEVVTVPGRDHPLALADLHFSHLVENFAEIGPGRLRILWQTGANWNRVRLSVLPDSMGVLIEERSCPPPYGLSRREIDVLTGVAMGMSNQTIADALFVSSRTVHTHVEHVLRKLEVSSRLEACAVAIREALVRPLGGPLLSRGVQTFAEPSTHD